MICISCLFLIYHSNGEYTLPLESKTSTEYILLEDLPDYLPSYFIAVEDKRFYKHGAVDFLGIARAALVGIKNGELTQGGSTITQQVAKNVFLSNDQTVKRKLKELWIAKSISQTYTTEEILEVYLNHIYYGAGATGIQQAAKTYFGKDASELTKDETALLVGLPQAPSDYNPFEHKDLAIQRRNVVLGILVENNLISESESQEIKASSLVLYNGK